jgi:hypothetical protein
MQKWPCTAQSHWFQQSIQFCTDEADVQVTACNFFSASFTQLSISLSAWALGDTILLLQDAGEFLHLAAHMLHIVVGEFGKRLPRLAAERFG